MRHATLSRLIDLAAQLERDAQRPADVLRRRDRALGRELGEAAHDVEGGVVAWLDRVRPEGVEGPGERVARAGRLLQGALVVAGAALGVGSSLALFHYDGTEPVNVVRVLAVFVGIQLALLTGTLVLSLPERWRRFVPGLAALKDGFALLSPGRWQGALRRLLPGPQREAVERFFGLARRHQRLYGDVQKWWLLCGSQSFGVAFNVAALAVAFSLVAFTDLAFGWSTTLDVDAGALFRVTRVLSLPWAGLLPAAVPSPELIAATQYFRAIPTHDPIVSEPWWRFLLACMVVYGLAPRATVLAIARLRLAASVRRAFRHAPGVAALRDRLETRLVETAAPDGSPPPPPASSAAASDAALAPGARCRVLVWAGFPIGDAAEASQALGVEVLSVHRAGEGALEQDADALREIAEAGGDDPILVIAKAWEPPVLELLDFLRDLRGGLSETREILVVPLSLDATSQPAAPPARQAAQWSRATDRLGDPRTQVHAPGRSS